MKLIRDIARKNIQQAQSTQKKQYDKSTHPVTAQEGDLVMINEQLKFKLDRPYHGPFRVYEVTDTNAKIKPVSDPDGELRCVSLQKVSKCKGQIATCPQVWLGHGKTKSRKRRTVRKRGGR